MREITNNFKFIIVTLTLIVLILAEIIFLGYKFWFKKVEVLQEPCPSCPTLSPLPTVALTPAKPFIQLVFGVLENMTTKEVTLVTEEGQKVSYPFEETEIFSFQPQKEEKTISLISFFDEDFEKKSGVERIELEDIKPGSPTYLILELTAEDLYLGRRLVIIKE